MKIFACFGKKLQHLCSSSIFKLACCCKSTCFLISCFYYSILLKLNPFVAQLLYFISVSGFGFWILKLLKPRTSDFTPRNIDVFFTSVSATTVSSMSTVEMEVFSNSQLIFITFLMFVGGEVFTSMVGLHFLCSKLKRAWRHHDSRIESVSTSGSSSGAIPTNFDDQDQIELDIISVISDAEKPKSEFDGDEANDDFDPSDSHYLKYSSIKFLGFLVLGYLFVIHVLGTSAVLTYISLVSSAKSVLRNKGLKRFTFAIFTTVSTFASCGFVPTNENMIVFSRNSGLLLILIPQVLFGNTLFPPFLRLSIWFVGKFFKRREVKYLLKNTREIGYLHLLPSLYSLLLVATVVGFIILQFILFCSMQWDSEALSGLSNYEKFIGSLFQVVNARHTGETIVDLSTIAPAILVLFTIMMYLPPYTSFLPIKNDHHENDDSHYSSPQGSVRRKLLRKERTLMRENLIFSQLSYLAIFVILICITERKRMKEDPLNFNVLSIVFEVISAYGNVGFSMGYSCERMIKPDASCENKWYGFSGKWSDGGKCILIIVMLFGRLKKFNMNGGKAWKLL